MANVILRNVQKNYGDVEVLLGIDLEIHDGEFITLVGPSGCGKSTLLRMIAGLEEIGGGGIEIGGTQVNDVPANERDIAMVFQSYALYPHMSVRQNMEFALRMRGEDKKAIEARVDAAANILGLETLMDRKPKELSGGQRQRVAMGRAIVRQPKVFLFDEPLSNLDAKLRVKTRLEIKRLHHRLGATSIFVTHDQIEAMTMADRIVLLHDGIIQQVGMPNDLYHRPANKFVAGFVGSPEMNFIDGTVDAPDGVPLLRSQSGRELLKLEGIDLSALTGKKITLGVRPEHLLIGKQGTGFEMSVDETESTGHETFLFGKVEDTGLCVQVSGSSGQKAGDNFWVSPDPTHMHLFDAGTGERLPS